MTQALTAYKAWAVKTEKATGPQHIQYLSLTITGANTDTAWDFGTTSGTFWTAAGGSTAGAAAKKLLYAIGAKAEEFIGLAGSVMKDWFVGASASGAAFTLVSGTATGTVDLAFASGSAPTAETVVFAFLMKEDTVPLNVSG